MIFAFLRNLFTPKTVTHSAGTPPLTSSAITPSTSASAKPSAGSIKGAYKHYKNVPMDKWRWPNFTPQEVASNGDYSVILHFETLDKMQALRNAMGAQLVVNSWYRDAAHNKRVGGGAKSMHLKGRAVDISIFGHDPKKLYAEAEAAGFTGFGFYDTFLHVDTGKRRSWGKAGAKFR